MKRSLLVPLILLAAPGLARAEDGASGGEPTPAAVPLEEVEEVLPTNYPVSRYSAIWENSPFTREVASPAVQTIESSFAQGLTLEGIVQDDTLGPIAYLRDVANNQPLVVTSEESSGHPYRIVSARQTHDPQQTKVTLTDGKETGEIGFVASKLTEAIAQIAPQKPEPNPRDNAAKGAPRVPFHSGALSTGVRPPAGGTNVSKEEKESPQSVTPALDKLDSQPVRRRVPLPGN